MGVIFCVCLLLSLASSCLAATDKPILPKDIVRQMKLGINLGNVLEAPIEGDWAPKANESYFDQYKAKGFKCVRIPVRWDNHTQTEAPYAIDPVFMARVHQVVGWSMDRGFITLINSHHDEWLDDVDNFDAMLPRFKAIWTQVAKTFSSYNHTLVFEVFNEPHHMNSSQLNAMNAATLPIMRNLNPTRIVLFGGLQFMNPNWILDNPDTLVFPKSDPYVMLEVHNYDPFKYAGPNPTDHNWGSEEDKQALQTWIASLKTWAEERKISVLYGEFGVTGAQTPATGRLLWYQLHREYALAAGFAMMAWDDDGNFKLFDRATGVWNEGILKALGLSDKLNTQDKVCNVKDSEFGAVGDGVSDDTLSIRAALNSDCDIVLLSAPGNYLSGPVNLTRDNQVFRVEAGATLLASTTFSDYPIIDPLPSYQWSQDCNCFNPAEVKYKIAPGKRRYAPVVGGYNLTNITLDGGGTINGQGRKWWDACYNCTHLHQNSSCLIAGRPKLLEFQYINGLHINGLRLENSPFWTLTPSYSQNIVIENMNIYAPWNASAVIGNTDGINIDSCRNVLVQNSLIDNGDDGVSMKSGLNQPGIDFGTPTENVLVRNITCAKTSRCGLAVGSEMSGGIRNVTFEDSSLMGQRNIHIKSSIGRGGLISDITYRNIQSTGVSLSTTYGGGPPNGAKPSVANLTFINNKGGCGFHCEDTVDHHCDGITIIGMPGCKSQNTPPVPSPRASCLMRYGSKTLVSFVIYFNPDQLAGLPVFLMKMERLNQLMLVWLRARNVLQISTLRLMIIYHSSDFYIDTFILEIQSLPQWVVPN
eukprot:m.81725 g.81725  ORF g.81725 m.81725 type:complete len:813 (+) comp12823_c0_seq3:113-2551(+)